MTNKVEVGVSIPLKIENAEKEVNKLQGQLSRLDLGKTLSKDFANLFGNLQKEFDKVKSLTTNNKLKIVDDKAVGKSVDRIINLYESLQKKMASEGISTAFLKSDVAALKGLQQAQEIYTKAIKDSVKEEEKLNNELERTKQKKAEIEKSHSKKPPISDAAYFDLQAKEKALKSQRQKAVADSGKLRTDVEAEIQKSGKPVTFDKLPPNSIIRRTEAYKKYKEVQQEAIRLEKEHKEVVKALNTTMSESQAKQQMEQATTAIAEAQQKLNAFKSEGGKGFKDQVDGLKAMKDHLLSIKGVDWSKMGIDVKSIKSIEELNRVLATLKKRAMANGEVIQKNLTDPMKNLGQTVQETGKEYTQASLAVQQAQEKATTAENFSNRIKYFLSLNGAIMLLRRTLRNAMQTVKELDAQMTEMAVVTDLGIGDYWEQLPEYTARANELGVSIKGAYEAATLYYQQGLKTNEVIEISNETLKMARIAGLGAEDATNKMTAALRGFNMELSETSAQKVNDVYSKLAAITASDTKEISTAMTKTASIAHNAGMEFETTAAFLSQIIETTRESAETAGTAMKTIIARFQELKKSPDKIIEVDGEKVDANKIEGALRSVGVALRDEQGQFRQLDKVFIELASKWDTLDTNTQRYIATIAAGSRQQSRFIAMMSDYGRTAELIDAANNSAGASQEQFNKTLDSLQTKLQRLKNAWNSFSMGIMNSDLVKFGVDFLTSIITTLDKVSKSFGGVFNSITKIAMAYALIKTGKALFDAFSFKVISHFRFLGQQASENFQKGFTEQAQVPMAGEKGNPLNPFRGMSNLTALSSGNMATFEQGFIDKVAIAKQTKREVEYKYKTKLNEAYKAEKELAKKENRSAKSHKAIKAQFKDSEEKRALDKATKEQMEANQKLADHEAETLQFRKDQWQKFGQGISSAGQTAMMAGVAFGMLGTALENMGVEGAAESFSNFGAILNNLGMTAMTIGPVFGKLAAAFTKTGKSVAAAGAAAGGVILAVVAGIALLLYVFKKIKENSPAERLKRLNAVANESKERAKGLDEEYTKLNEQLSALDKQQEAIKKMTENTTEWKESVHKVNLEVLQLLKEIPELKLSNNNGVLSIDMQDQHNRAILENKRIEAIEAKITASANQQIAESGALNIDRGQMIGALNQGVVSANDNYIQSVYHSQAVNGNSQPVQTLTADEIVDNVSIALQKGYAVFNNGVLEATNIGEEELKSLGLSSEYLQYIQGSLEQIQGDMEVYVKNRIQQEQKDKIYAQEQIQYALQIADLSSDKEKTVRNWTSAEYYQDIREQYKKQAEGFEWKKSDEDYSRKKYVGEKLYGEDFLKVKGDKIHFLKDGKEETRKLTKEDWAKYWTTYSTSDAIVENMKTLPKAFREVQKIDPTLAKIFNGTEGQNFTREDLKKGKYSRESLGEIYDKLSKGAKNDLGSKKFFVERALKEQQISDDLFKENLDRLEGIYGKRNSLFDKTDATTESRIIDNLITMANVSGQGQANGGLDQLIKYSKGLSKEKSNQFLNILGDSDWTSLNDWDSVEKELLNNGFELDSELKGLIGNLRDLNKATRKLTKEQLEKVYKEVGAIQKNFKKGSQGRNFSKEQYEAIVMSSDKNLKDRFIQNLDGSFTYLGSSIESLSEELSKNTLMLADRDKIAKSEAEKVKEFMENMVPFMSSQADEDIVYTDANNGNMSYKQIYEEYNKMLDEWDTYVKNSAGSSDYLKDVYDDFVKPEVLNAVQEIESKYMVDLNDTEDWTKKDYIAYLNKLQGEDFDFEAIGLTGFNQFTNLNAQDLDTLANWVSALQQSVFNYSNTPENPFAPYQSQDLSKNLELYSSSTDAVEKDSISKVIQQQAVELGASDLVLKQLEEAFEKGDESAINKLLKPLIEIEKTSYEQVKIGRKNYQDLENRIKTALIKEKQDKIDADSKLFDLLNEMNDDILSNMQEQLEEQRQARENDKTENELNDLYNQLSYLEMDSSGRNAGEILELQKQIAEKEQGYQDSLIDQEISDMEKANEEAADQRERQIQIAQDTLKAWEESGAIWTLVDQKITEMKHEMISKGINAADTVVGKWLGASEGTDLMSTLGKADWALALNKLTEVIKDWKTQIEQKEEKRNKEVVAESNKTYADQQLYEKAKGTDFFNNLSAFRVTEDENQAKMLMFAMAKQYQGLSKFAQESIGTDFLEDVKKLRRNEVGYKELQQKYGSISQFEAGSIIKQEITSAFNLFKGISQKIIDKIPSLNALKEVFTGKTDIEVIQNIYMQEDQDPHEVFESAANGLSGFFNNRFPNQQKTLS